MHPEIIRALEGDPDGQVLSLRAFKNNKFGNAVALGPVGGEERASIIPTGAYAGRDLQVIPGFSRLDLKSSNIDGLAAMGRRYSDERTKLLPIMILSSSKKDQELINVYRLAVNGRIHKPLDIGPCIDAVRESSLYRPASNEASPFKET